MDLPEIISYQDIATTFVLSIINKATEKLGVRKNLFQYANEVGAGKAIISVKSLTAPLAITSEKLIINAIEKVWSLTDTFSYHLRYLGGSQDEVSQYYYHEVIFSQPTSRYPIPQATVSVFFRVEDKHTEPAELQGLPQMIFRIEGHHTDHDVRYVKLTKDWIMAVLQIKIKFFRRIEKIKLF